MYIPEPGSKFRLIEDHIIRLKGIYSNDRSWRILFGEEPQTETVPGGFYLHRYDETVVFDPIDNTVFPVREYMFQRGTVLKLCSFPTWRIDDERYIRFQILRVKELSRISFYLTYLQANTLPVESL